MMTMMTETHYLDTYMYLVTMMMMVSERERARPPDLRLV